MEKYKYNKIVIVEIILMLIAISLTNLTFSKYVLDGENSYSIKSSEFYFNSSLGSLDNTEIFEINDWDLNTEKEVSFSVNNFVVDPISSEEKYTTKDITFLPVTKFVNNLGNELETTPAGISALIVDNSDNTLAGNQILTGNVKSENTYKLKISATDVDLISNGDEFYIKLSIVSESPYFTELTQLIKVTANKEEVMTTNLEENQTQDIPENGEENQTQDIPENGEEKQTQDITENGEEKQIQDIPENGEEKQTQDIPENDTILDNGEETQIDEKETEKPIETDEKINN